MAMVVLYIVFMFIELSRERINRIGILLFILRKRWMDELYL